MVLWVSAFKLTKIETQTIIDPRFCDWFSALITFKLSNKCRLHCHASNYAFLVYEYELWVQKSSDSVFMVPVNAYFHVHAQISLFCPKWSFHVHFQLQVEPISLFAATPGNSSGCCKCIHIHFTRGVETETNKFGITM